MAKSPHRTGHGWLMGAQLFESKISKLSILRFRIEAETVPKWQDSAYLFYFSDLTSTF